MHTDINSTEEVISSILAKPEISKDDWVKASYLFAIILTDVFSNQAKDSGLRTFSIDDMYPDSIDVQSKKFTLKGSIHWLGGGEGCVKYQVDIARNSEPLLYSYKLKNKHELQVMYIGRTCEGWIVNDER